VSQGADPVDARRDANYTVGSVVPMLSSIQTGEHPITAASAQSHGGTIV
jgi:hypothetical protein